MFSEVDDISTGMMEVQTRSSRDIGHLLKDLMWKVRRLLEKMWAVKGITSHIGIDSEDHREIYIYFELYRFLGLTNMSFSDTRSLYFNDEDSVRETYIFLRNWRGRVMSCDVGYLESILKLLGDRNAW